MKITRNSVLTGKSFTMDIPVTEEELAIWYRGGILIQNAFPNLTPDQREFILNGITPEEWKEVFGNDYQI